MPGSNSSLNTSTQCVTEDVDPIMTPTVNDTIVGGMRPNYNVTQAAEC